MFRLRYLRSSDGSEGTVTDAQRDGSERATGFVSIDQPGDPRRNTGIRLMMKSSFVL